MSQATAVNNLSTIGVWAYPATVTPESANELEQLGYSALWLADPGTELDPADRVLAATERLVVGTYIINVWSTPAEAAAEVFHRIDKAFPQVSEQKVVLTDDPQRARALGRDGLGTYLGLMNVQRSLHRIGFRDDDLSPPGSDRLVDALVAYRTADDVAARLNEHLNAGADQVLVNALAPDNNMLPVLRALAGRN